jgi:hypothetical protein
VACPHPALAKFLPDSPVGVAPTDPTVGTDNHAFDHCIVMGVVFYVFVCFPDQVIPSWVPSFGP